MTPSEIMLRCGTAIAGLGEVTITGRAERINRSRKGVLYFCLIDDAASVQCFGRFDDDEAPVEGETITARGTIQVFAHKSEIQLRAKEVSR